MKFLVLKKSMTAVFALLLGTAAAGAATVTVGPNGQYASPCAAFQHLSDGDTVQVDANNGVPYNEGNCKINNNNLTIVGVNGRPILDAANVGISKAIWDESGHDVVIDNFEFRMRMLPTARPMRPASGSRAAHLRTDTRPTAATSPSSGATSTTTTMAFWAPMRAWAEASFILRVRILRFNTTSFITTEMARGVPTTFTSVLAAT